MKTSYIIFIFFTLSSICSFGQTGKQACNDDFLFPGQGKKTEPQSQVPVLMLGISKSNSDKYNRLNEADKVYLIYQKTKPDSAYYHHIVKQNGWFRGIGTKLTKEEASQLSCYYKLSKRNAAGNWTFMQAYNGYSQLTTYHSIGTYLANQWDDQDNGLNKDWKKKLQQVCQWEFIGNAKGNEVIQERGLDVLGNVMFAYSPVKFNDSTYVGTFTDAWGMPIYMRTDSLGNDIGYANFVQIVRDKRGYEVLYKYVDRNGTPVKNKDGAYMTRKAYDDAGNQTMEASLGITGNRMIDDYGNCGWEDTYDEDGNRIICRYYDEEWKPIRIPTNRGNTDNIYGYWFEYDNYGRETKRGFLDKDGNLDVNQYGSYKIEQEYNEHGLQTILVSYDRMDNKIAYDSLGTAECINKIDKNGYYILSETKDAKGNLLNNEDGVCKKTWTYNGKTEIAETEYQIKEGAVQKKYDYERDSLGNEQRKWYNDDLIRIDSVDGKGNEKSLAYYDLILKPKDLWGYHKRMTTYKYDKHSLLITREWYDKDGSWAIEKNSVGTDFGYSSEEIIVDSIKHTIQKKQYLNGKVKQCFTQVFDQSFNKVLIQYDITHYGVHARVGWWDNLHFKANTEYNFRGNLLCFKGSNEFDEPSYLTGITDNTTYYYQQFSNGKSEYFDEDGNEIKNDSMVVFRENLPKAFCIEVTDTTKANSYGIKNGDIILSYGEWHTSEDLRSNLDYFYLETILKNKSLKQMTVLRHHPENKNSEIITLQLGIGSPSELGFYAHQICYTRKEKERLLQCANANLFKFNSIKHKYSHPVVLGLPMKGSLDQSYLYWKSLRKDPFVTLYCEHYPFIIKNLDTWSWANDSIEKLSNKNIIAGDYKGIKKMNYSDDMNSIKDYEWTGKVGLRYFVINVDDSVYNITKRLYVKWIANDSKLEKTYIWNKDKGYISEDQFIDSLKIVTSSITLRDGEKSDFPKLLSHFEHFNKFLYFDRDNGDLFDRCNQKAELIKRLNKNKYENVSEDSEYTKKRDLFIWKKKNKKEITNALFVEGQRIFYCSGNFTKEELFSALDWIIKILDKDSR